jgi:hypothetical protein
MAALTEKHKIFIVEKLACFESHTDVIEAVKREFDGLELSKQQVYTYDASHDRIRKRMAKDLVQLFDETRERFRERIGDIAIANKSYRLSQLGRLAKEARAKKNPILEKELYEQAAKECGDAYTNRREIGGKDGAPIPIKAYIAFDPEEV